MIGLKKPQNRAWNKLKIANILQKADFGTIEIGTIEIGTIEIGTIEKG